LPVTSFSILNSQFSIAIDGRLMVYRKAGIAQYTRRLVQALSSWSGSIHDSRFTFHVLLDRRDTDTAWLPSNVRVLRTVTPAHHRYERFTLPLELISLDSPFSILHSPDFITCRGRFKKVITIHDLYFMEHPEVMSADGARYYSRARWSAQTADRIIAVSNFTRDEILRLMPEISTHKIAVVHEAPDELKTPNAEWRKVLSRFSILDSQFALFVGTFEPRKNLVTLLRALARLPNDVHLVVVGESGWGEAEPGRIVQTLGVGERVHLAGRVSDDDLDALYRGARLLAMPSLSEGFGLPVLEAMARGAPVVCSDAGALPEIAGDAALYHEPLDDAALAQAMTVLWTNGALRDEYSRRGRQRTHRFSWQRAAQATLAVYRTVMGHS
jgi:glycosyltransferase involved in cell wall biosynthesis